MWNGHFRPACAWAFLALCIVLGTTGCGSIVEPNLPETTVANLPGEDLAGPCTYALRLATGPIPAPGQPPAPIPQAGVLVVFERGDSVNLFEDPKLIAMAQQLHLSVMYAYQCDAKSIDDIQFNGAAGPGRALFQALTQFGTELSHPELATTNVFLTGFSAAGLLSITTANTYPDRVLGTIPYAPASAYTSLNTVDVTKAAGVPSLILVSDQDVAAGDQLPLFLFQRGWALGARWGFGSQHAFNHCCTDSIAPLLIPWVEAIFNNYTSPQANGAAAPVSQTSPAPPVVAFQVAVDGSFDPFGWQNFYIGSYSLLPSTAGGPYEAWLPDSASTQAWVSWISASN